MGGLVIVIEELGLPVITTVLAPGQRTKRRFGSRLIHIPPKDECRR